MCVRGARECAHFAPQTVLMRILSGFRHFLDYFLPLLLQNKNKLVTGIWENQFYGPYERFFLRAPYPKIKCVISALVYKQRMIDIRITIAFIQSAYVRVQATEWRRKSVRQNKQMPQRNTHTHTYDLVHSYTSIYCMLYRICEQFFESKPLFIVSIYKSIYRFNKQTLVDANNAFTTHKHICHIEI